MVWFSCNVHLGKNKCLKQPGRIDFVVPLNATTEGLVFFFLNEIYFILIVCVG